MKILTFISTTAILLPTSIYAVPAPFQKTDTNIEAGYEISFKGFSDFHGDVDFGFIYATGMAMNSYDDLLKTDIAETRPDLVNGTLVTLKPENEFAYSEIYATENSRHDIYISDAGATGDIHGSYVRGSMNSEYIYKLDIFDSSGTIETGATISINFDYKLLAGYYCSDASLCNVVSHSTIDVVNWDGASDSATTLWGSSLTYEDGKANSGSDMLSSSFSVDFAYGVDELWVGLGTSAYAHVNADCLYVHTESGTERSGSCTPVSAFGFAYSDPLITASFGDINLDISKQLAEAPFSLLVDESLGDVDVSVPEPQTIWLFTCGLFGLVSVMGKKINNR